MTSFSNRLEKRLSDSARIKRGEVSRANIATSDSLAELRREIAAKVGVNEAMCTKSLEIAAKMPLR